MPFPTGAVFPVNNSIHSSLQTCEADFERALVTVLFAFQLCLAALILLFLRVYLVFDAQVANLPHTKRPI
jgi:hypothetical protein